LKHYIEEAYVLSRAAAS